MSSVLPKGELMAFSPTNCLPEDSQFSGSGMDTNKENKDSIPVLSLVRFSTAPFVSFGTVKLGSSKSSLLRIDNPTDEAPIDVNVDRIASSKGFSVDQTKFTIEPGGSTILTITWTPAEEGGVRELITFIANGIVKHQAVLLGRVEAPKKKKKSLWDSIKNKKTDSSVSYRTKKPLKAANKTFHVPRQPQYKREKQRNPLSPCNIERLSLRPKPGYENLPQEKPCTPQSSKMSLQDNIENISYQSISPNLVLIPANKLLAVPPTTDTPQTPTGLSHRRVLNKTLSPIATTFRCKNQAFQSPLPVIKTHSVVAVSDQVPLSGSPLMSLKEALVIIDSDLSQPVSPPNACSSFDFSDSLESEKGGLSNNLEEREASEDVPSLLNPAEPRLTFFVKPKLASERGQGDEVSCEGSVPARPPVCSVTITKSRAAPRPASSRHERRIKTSRRKLLKEELPSFDQVESVHQPMRNTGGLPVIDLDARQGTPDSPTYSVSSSGASGSSSDCASTLSSHCSPLVTTPTLMPPSSSSTSQSAGWSHETVQCDVSSPDVQEQEKFVVYKPLPPHLGKKRKSDEFLRENAVDAKFEVKRSKPQSGQTMTDSRVPKKGPVALSTVQQKQPKAAVPSSRSCTIRRTPRPLSKPPPPKTNQRAPSVKSLSSSMKKSKVIAVAQSQLTFIKPAQTVIPRHPMPFAAKNMFYDERWLEKQEQGFTWWINYVLTPDDFRVTTEVTKVNALSLTTGDHKFAVAKAPTKEEMSLRTYTARRRLNRLRRSACQLFTSDTMVKAIQRLEIEVEAKRLLIRKDRHLWKDLGERQKVLNWLLSYNPLWLRIGMETIYGELISLEGNNDVMGLAMFILGRLLWNPDIAAEYRHAKVPNLYRDGHEEALSRFTLKKLLLLVCFLDQAKESRLIEHDPCLFCMDAEFKTSKDLLLAFSRDFLSGEGILSRHLGHLGLAVSHVQTPLDEFNFAVSNLATDLRCGIRLVRVMELFTQDWSLSKKLRMPVISRLQKVHNVELAFQVLKVKGVDLKEEHGTAIDSRDIVDGHREKTLNLLWKIIFAFQVEVLLDEEQLKEEISFLRRTWQMKQKLNSLRTDKSIPLKVMKSQPEIKHSSMKITLLMAWVNAVSEFYNLKAENFTVSFSDGRILCHLVHHYHPSQLPLEKVRQETTQTIECGHRGRVELDSSCSDSDTSINEGPVTQNGPGSSSVDFKELLENERSNFLLVNSAVSYLGGVPAMINPSDMSNTIPNEKVVICFLSFLCTRLLDLRNETRAARVIQGAWRKYRLKKDLELYQLRNVAASKIQAVVKRFLLRRRAEKGAVAAIAIQTAWRSYAARQFLKRMKLAHHLSCRNHAAIIIQKVYRGWWTREFLRRNQAATVIQACYRIHACRKQYHKLKCAAVSIQAWFRGCSQRRRFLSLKLQQSSAITIQSAYRGNLVRRQVAQMRGAALLVQRWFRACRQRDLDRLHYLKMRQATVTLQAAYRGLQTRKELERRHRAALTIQTAFRMTVAQRAFRALKRAVVIVQRRYRAKVLGERVRSNHLELRHAAVTLQAIWRGRAHRKKMEKLHRCATLIQAQYRCHAAQSRFRAQRTAALVIQRQYRAFHSAMQARTEYLGLRRAAVVLQAVYRGMHVRQALRRKNHAATVIQAYVRAFACRQQYLALRVAASVIQQHYRARLLGRAERVRYQQVQRAAVKLQATFRGFMVRRHLQRKHQAATIIQARFRAHKVRVSYLAAKCAATIIQRRYRAVVAGRQALGDFLVVRAAVLTVQSAFRGMQARRRVRKMHTAAVVIQRTYKTYKQRKEYLVLRVITIKMQRRFRATLMAIQEQRQFHLLRDAAITIQSMYRGMKVRKEIQKQQKAATVIQTYVRAFACRRQYLALRVATCVIQQHYRARLLGRAEQVRYKQVQRAAVKLQATFRGLMVRRHLQRKHQAATIIQARFRAHKVRVSYLAAKCAATIIQRRYRAVVAGRQALGDFLVVRAAVLTVQSAFRGMQARRRVRKMHTAAVVIQRTYKTYKQRKEYLVLRVITIKIQRRFRATLMAIQEQRQFHLLRDAAITIQSMYRGMKVRKEIQKQQKAATVIQAYYRMYRTRVRFQATRLASEVIQRQYRHHLKGKRVREEYLKLRQTATTVQAIFRGSRARREVQTMHSAACIIQAQLRMRCCRTRYQKLLWATRVLQEKFKANRERDSCTEQYNAKKKAALKIQSAFRGYQARQEIRTKHKMATLIQTKYLTFKERKNFLALKAAAVFCQRQYRAQQMAMQCRQEYLDKRKACVTIQACYRGMKVRQCLQQKNKAVVVIQAYVRKQICRSYYLRLLRAVQVIQHRYRAKLEMKKHLEDYQRKKRAVVMLQAAFRGMKGRQRLCQMHQAAIVLQSHLRACHQRRRYLALHVSTLIIQQWYRAMKAGREERQRYLSLRNAALTLQASFRGHRTRMEVLRQHQAATVFQAGFRRHREQVKFQAMRLSAIIIQRRYRAYAVGQGVRRDYIKLRDSAVAIQAAFRGSRTRRRAVEEHRAATVIQAHFRRHRQRLSFRKQRWAAIVLQQSYRALQLRNEHVQNYQQLRTAAICLQAAFRGKKAREQAKRMKAARTIQSFLKMSVKRRHYKEMKAASVTIQAAFRAHRAQRRYTEVRAAATVIQIWYRSCQRVQRERAGFKMVRQAALTLQSAFRGMQVRRKAKQEHAAVKIQAVVNMATQRRRFLQMRGCAVKLQAGIRMYLARSSYLRRCSAALVLQRRYRAQKAQQEQRHRYLHTVRSLTIVQAHLRGALEQRRFQKLKTSAITIQAAYRGTVVRRDLECRKAAVAVIQRHYRAHVHFQRDRVCFLKMKKSALLIQRAFRQHQLRKYAQQEQAAVKIQAWFRGGLARRQCVARRAAVATIHRCLQARLQRIRYLALQQSTGLIQQRWRDKLAARQQHQNYLNMKASAVAIQALWRGHRDRLRIHKERRAATLIQAHFRGHAQKQYFRRLREAALKIQRRFRAVRQERLEKAKKKRRNTAATTLQAYCRGWLTRRSMKEAENAQRRLRFSAAVYHHLCAAKIQRAFRAHQALKMAKKQIHSVIYIQRWMRAKLQRKRYLEERRWVVVAQRAARAWLARRHRAAAVIQRAVRGLLFHRRQEKMQRGIIKAQALWRGHCSRKLNDTRKIVAMRHRFRKISQSVNEEDCLRNKTITAIGYLLGCYNFGYIILAMKYLDTATRLSPECCEHLVKSGATEKIVILIRSCNRSLPSMELISLSVQVLLNLSKYNRTIEAVFAVEHAVDMLLDLLQIYREKAGDKMADKGGSIFTKACFLLILLVQDRHRAAEVRKIPKALDRLRSIYHLTMRKCKKDTERMTVRQKMTGSLNGSLLVQATPRKSKMPPRFAPEWVLRRDKLADIIDPLCAIQMLANVLCMQP